MESTGTTIRALLKCKDANELIPLLKADSLAIRRMAEDRLMQIDGEAALLAALQHENSLIRAGACRILGKIRSRAAQSQLQDCLRDDDKAVIVAALSALGKLRVPESLPSIITMMQQDAALIVQITGARALRNFEKIDRALPHLISLLQSHHLLVQLEVMAILVRHPQQQVVAAVVACFRNLAAAPAQHRVGDYVAYFGAAHLGVIETLKPDVIEIAARLVAQMGEVALVPLLACLQSEDATLRYYVTIAIGAMGANIAMPHLKSLQEKQDPRLEPVIQHFLD